MPGNSAAAMPEERLSRDRLVGIGGAVAATGILVAAAWVWVLPRGPVPTDDMFYIDAAYRLSHGTFETPTRSFPYHHYLRWPVVVPLAGLVQWLGPGERAWSAYTLLHLGIISAAAAWIAFQLSRNRLIAAMAALTPLLVPSTMITPYIRAEPAALAWMLLGACLVVGAQRGVMLRHFLGGICGALAVSASQVALFSLPLIPLLCAGENAERSRAKLRRIAGFAGGMALAYGLIIAIEGAWLHDPLIEYHCLKWWHFQLADVSPRLSGLFDPADERHFLFAFLFKLIRALPLFVMMSLVFALLPAMLQSETDRTRTAWAVVVVPYLLLEFVAPFVVEKDVLRYLSIPVFFLCLLLVMRLEHVLGRIRINVAAVPPALIMLAAAALWVRANVAQIATDDPSVGYYRDTVHAVLDAVHETGATPDQVVIGFDNQGLHGLIQWYWAVNIYSGYALAPADVKLDAEPEALDGRPIAIFVRTAGREAAAPEGFVPASQQPDDPSMPMVFIKNVERRD